MFTGSPPEFQGDFVHLFFSPHDAAAASGRHSPIYPVAVHYDALYHRLLPLEPVATRPGWTAPARHKADGSVTTTEPIPHLLFLTPQSTSQRSAARRPR